MFDRLVHSLRPALQSANDTEREGGKKNLFSSVWKRGERKVDCKQKCESVRKAMLVLPSAGPPSSNKPASQPSALASQDTLEVLASSIVLLRACSLGLLWVGNALKDDVDLINSHEEKLPANFLTCILTVKEEKNLCLGLIQIMDCISYFLKNHSLCLKFKKKKPSEVSIKSSV